MEGRPEALKAGRGDAGQCRALGGQGKQCPWSAAQHRKWSGGRCQSLSPVRPHGWVVAARRLCLWGFSRQEFWDG